MHSEPELTRLWRANPGEWLGLGTALAWAAFHTSLYGTAALGIALLFFNGFAVAVYATLIGLSRVHSTRVAIGAGVIVLLGLTHGVWLIPATLGLLRLSALVLPDSWIQTYEDSFMLAATGGVFMIPLLVMTRSPGSLAVLLGCTVLSYWIDGAQPFGGEGFLVSVSLLHVGISVSHFLIVVRDRVPGTSPSCRCGSCGYSLAGLPSDAPCPECGEPHKAAGESL